MYYSNFKITVFNSCPAQWEEIITTLNDLEGSEVYECFLDCLEEIIKHNACSFPEQELTWYDYRTDLTTLSKAFPNITIFCHREGEDYDDIEENIFKSGKYETRVAKLIRPNWDKFNKEISGLKELSNQTIEEIKEMSEEYNS